MTWSWVRRDTGGSTPKPSHVSKIMLLGWPLTAGSLALGMYCSGYAHRVFSVMDTSSKSISRFSVSKMTFSTTAPKRIALKISGSPSAESATHLA